MKKIMLCALSFISLYGGVSVDTIVETSNGSQQIGLLKVGDKIICFNNNLFTEEKSVLSIDEIETDKVVEITTEDGVTISMAADQQIFIPRKWVRADQLSLGDILLKKDQTFIGIESIRHKNESTKLRFIVVEDYHNFLATKNGVLVHNGPYTAYTVYCATKASLIAALVTATATTVCVADPAAAVPAAGSVVMGTEATIGATAVFAGAGAGAATAGGIAGTTAAVALAIETASLAAAAPFAACLWCL